MIHPCTTHGAHANRRPDARASYGPLRDSGVIAETSMEAKRAGRRRRECAGYCAPLPVSTTPTVSNRTTMSRNSVWFFT